MFDRIINPFQKKCGFLIDSPKPGGGNTNCGPLGKLFFSPKHRYAICELIEDDDKRANYSELLRLENQLLSVTQNVDDSKV